MRESPFKHVTRDEIIKWAMELVAIPSYKTVPGRETKSAEYIKAVFDAEGIETEIRDVVDGRCNIYAWYRGTGGGKNLLFNGHTDTVSPYGMEKANEPYITENGEIWGRGTADMKGPLVSMMAAIIELKRSNTKLSGDVIFTGVIDEEERGYGIVDLVEYGFNADAAIVGEPCAFEVCVAQRGVEWFKFDFKGKQVHGGVQWLGINAISKATKFIRAVEEDLQPIINSRTHPINKASTVNVGVIQGGTELSTVAGDCTVWVDRRWQPYEEYEDVLKEFQDVIDRLAAEDPEFKCTMAVTDESTMPEGYIHWPFELDAGNPFAQLMLDKLTEASGEDVKFAGKTGWTDAGAIYHCLKIPTLVTGPGFVTEAHTTHEKIPIDHLLIWADAYHKVALDFCK